MIRDGARAALWRWREVGLAGGVAAVGLWVAAQGGYLLGPVGSAIAAVGVGLGVQAWRRVRFAQGEGAPGIVEVDEGQISYMGPELGGFVSVPELVELRLVTLRGRRLWRLRQADGQALLIPVDAAGAEALFDVFAALPGMDVPALLAALTPAQAGTGHAVAFGEAMQVIWRRAGRGVSVN